MKFTLKEVIEKHNALIAVSKKKLPVKIGYAVAKNASRMEPELKLIEKSRLKLIENYAEKNEDGKPIIEGNSYKLGDNMSAYAKEYEDYLNTETDIDIHQIPIEELNKLDDSRYDVLTPTDIASINFIFAE